MNTTEQTQEISMDNKIEVIQADIARLQTATNMQIIDTESVSQASSLLGEVKVRCKRVEELRKFFTAPLNEQVKKINNRFKMQLEPLQQMERSLKTKLEDYLREEERKAQEKARRQQEKEEEERRVGEEAERKAREEAEAKRREAENLKNPEERRRLEQEAEEKEKEASRIKDERELAIPEMIQASPRNIRTENGLISKKTVTKFEVVDKSKLPLDFLVPDEKAIRKAISEGKEIEGVRVYQDIQVSVRA